MALIVTYTCILMLHHLGEPPVITSFIEISSTVFTIIFAVELLLKAMAYGFVKMIKRSPADVYDCAVVCVALLAMFLDLFYGISFNALASTARITRVLMVFKVMRGAHALQEVCFCANHAWGVRGVRVRGFFPTPGAMRGLNVLFYGVKDAGAQRAWSSAHFCVSKRQ